MCYISLSQQLTIAAMKCGHTKCSPLCCNLMLSRPVLYRPACLSGSCLLISMAGLTRPNKLLHGCSKDLMCNGCQLITPLKLCTQDIPSVCNWFVSFWSKQWALVMLRLPYQKKSPIQFTFRIGTRCPSRSTENFLPLNCLSS